MATFTWTSTNFNVDGNMWNIGANWSPNGIPGAGDDVLIDPAPDSAPTIIGTATARSILLDAAPGESLSIRSGSTLSLGGALTITGGLLDNAGTIVGGTIDLAGGSVLDFGTLDSVALTQAAASDNFFGTIVNGLTILNGGGQGTLVGVPSFLGDQTVDNSIIQAPGRNTITADGTITFGPNLTIEAATTSTVSFTNATSASATYINKGTVEGGVNLDATFINDGLFIGNPASELTLGDSFENAGTLEIPTGTTVLAISPASVLTNDAGGTILVQGASTELNLFAQGTHTLGPNNGVIEVTQGATLAVASPLSGNSTIESDGSATVFFVGGLGSVTFEGTLTFDQSGFAADALTLRGTQPGSAGVLNMIGHAGGLTGGGTIDNGDVTLSAGGGLGAGTTLTLGPSLSVNATSGSNTLSAPLLINDGTITATTAGSSISFLGATFDNAGTIVIGSSVIASQTGTFINSGAFTLEAGSTFDVGDVTLAGLASLVNQGAVVNIVTLDGQGGTLDLTPTSPLNGATIKALENLTLIQDGGSITIQSGGTLSDVTWHGTIGIPDDSILAITNGITMAGTDGTGPGTIVLEGTSSSELNLLDNETLDNLTLEIGTTPLAPGTMSPPRAQDLVAAAGTHSQAYIQWKQQLDADDAAKAKTNWHKFVSILKAIAGHGAQVNLNDYFDMSGQSMNFGGSMQGGSPAVAAAAASAAIATAATASAIGVTQIEFDSFINTGTITAGKNYDFLFSSPTLINDGVLSVAGGIIDATTTLQGSGTLALGGDGGLILEGAVETGQTIEFDGFGGLQIFQPNAISAPIVGFAAGDYIDLANIVATTVVATPGTLIALDGSVAVAIFDFVGTYASSDFSVFSDNNGGTDIAIVACFAKGTQIATPSGPVAVEDLHEGDRIITVSTKRRKHRIIKWIGQRTLSCIAHPFPRDVMPVRIKAHAFGAHCPVRDLWLSPDHAVFVDGVLIPIRHLINDTTVSQQSVERVTYYHIEVDEHDVALAEGMPAETFLDTGNRDAFANSGEATQLHPELDRGRYGLNSLTWEASGCAPLVVTGPEVDKVRRRLARRAKRFERAQPRSTACAA